MNLDRMPTGGSGEACPESVNAPAYCSGDLSDSERQAFEEHLGKCPACSVEMERTRRILDRLSTFKDVTVERDLAPEILARLSAPQPAMVRYWAYRRVWAAAAALIVVLGGTVGIWVAQRSHSRVRAETAATSAQNDALAWLCRAQGADGSWNAAEWGGDKRFEVALSSLATLAILGTESLSEEQAAAVRKAVGYLVKQQSDTGVFGPSFGNAPYNHGMATLALLRAFEVLHDEALRPILGQALVVIRSRQTPDGGWGYWGQSEQESNLSVTLWQVEALKLAVTLGWEDAQPNVRRAIRWVASIADNRGTFGYRRTNDFPEGPNTLTAMGALAVLNTPDRALPPGWREKMTVKVRETAANSDAAADYYRTYFLTAAMKKIRDDATLRQLAMLQSALAKRQVANGNTRGSWNPDSQWGGVGGRIYSTAMASLSLE